MISNQENYRNTQILTANPMELIIMLYDEAIRVLKLAEESFAIEGPERLEAISNNILKAEDIITELAVSLDMGKGGEIARNLQRLYDFMLAHLSRANTGKVVQPLQEVRALLEELRDTWKQVAEKAPLSDQPMTRTGVGISVAG